MNNKGFTLTELIIIFGLLTVGGITYVIAHSIVHFIIKFW